MSKKILIVDDDPVILQGIMLVLKDAGYSIESSTRGEFACKKAKDTNPDLIILDVMLSGQDGRTIAKELKQKKSTKSIPIIMISASENMEKEVYKYGADDFIPKPFNTEQLLKRIETQINLK